MDLRQVVRESTYSDLKKAMAASSEPHARDKDAIVATMALCEAAAYYKTRGHEPVGCYDRDV